MDSTILSHKPFSAILTKCMDPVLAYLLQQEKEIRDGHMAEHNTPVITHEPYKSRDRELKVRMKQLTDDRAKVIQGLSSWLKPKQIPIGSLYMLPRRVYSKKFLEQNNIGEYPDPSVEGYSDSTKTVMEILDVYIGMAVVFGLQE